MFRLLAEWSAALAPLDPARPEVASVIEETLAELPPEPNLEALLAARERVWERVARARRPAADDSDHGEA